MTRNACPYVFIRHGTTDLRIVFKAFGTENLRESAWLPPLPHSRGHPGMRNHCIHSTAFGINMFLDARRMYRYLA